MSCAAPLVSQSDMFGLMPERMFFLLARTGSLARLETLNDPKSALRCYRRSVQEPLLNQVIAVVCQLFKQ